MIPGVVIDKMDRVTSGDDRSSAREDCARGEFDFELADRRAVPTLQPDEHGTAGRLAVAADGEHVSKVDG